LRSILERIPGALTTVQTFAHLFRLAFLNLPKIV